MPTFARSFARGGFASGRHSGACTSPGSTRSKPSKNAATSRWVRSTSGAVAVAVRSGGLASYAGWVEVRRPMGQGKVDQPRSFGCSRRAFGSRRSASTMLVVPLPVSSAFAWTCTIGFDNLQARG
jgi:hypothetical protein